MQVIISKSCVKRHGRCIQTSTATVPCCTHPGTQISGILKVTPDPVNKYFSLPCTNPGGHLAQPMPVQVCVYMRVQPPTKFCFRQTPETPEPLDKYIFYNTVLITPEGKNRYLLGVSTVRWYGIKNLMGDARYLLELPETFMYRDRNPMYEVMLEHVSDTYVNLNI